MTTKFWPLLLALLIVAACQPSTSSDSGPTDLRSPNGNLTLHVSLNAGGQVEYQLASQKQMLVGASTLGFEFLNQPALDSQLMLTNKQVSSFDETWEMPWGEQREVHNHYNELRLDFKEKEAPFRAFSVVWRLYDDGLGFRYEFPAQGEWTEAFITEENTQFHLQPNYTCWWIPGDWDSYEHLYNTTSIREIDAIAKRNHPNLIASYIPDNAVNTPFTWKGGQGNYGSIHEANLTDYPGMTLGVDTTQGILTSILVGSERQDYKAKRTLPFETPWRTIQYAERAGDLIESNLIVNLNEPNKLENTDFIQPMKYVGIWWELHLDKTTWAYETGRHGATTENALRHIDFAAENGIGGVLVEGWNHGWQRWIGFPDREGIFDFTTPYPDYDLQKVAQYAKEKGVEIIMHHETSAAPRTYEERLDAAFQLMKRLDIENIKSGYVGPIIPDGEHHHGQWMVNHYRKVLEKAAEYGICMDVHEPIKPTGIRRTYPNMMTREGVRGQEFNNFSVEGGNPPEHLPIIAFTRMLAGPIDYTPGIFKQDLAPYRPDGQVKTTLSQQLALYVVINSPLQMAADLLENYEGHPAFQFIRDVGVNWEQTRVLDGEVGDFVTIAREERETGDWFVGSITDENPRNIKLKLDFLQDSTNYLATIYADTEESHWDTNPGAYQIEQRVVDPTTVLDLYLAPGGGAAISIIAEE
ncbi:MAG: glycoside hydrolase family 97 protein [Phaeodactylibacter sp.]|nr:glycoside hydrolase family 97 protein [Phaeodactylibacter sp.]